MAVRQYVGARYVPKFYQNSQNPLSSEWEGNKAYEAMTIVTYNNSSYTSKIPVPAGIGNPASNPTYWACTGNYNSQVEQYRQNVEEVSNSLKTETNERKDAEKKQAETNNGLENLIKGNYYNVKNVSNRYFLFCGDSYGAGELGYEWPSLVATYLGLSSDQYTNACISGAPFWNQRYLIQLQNFTGDKEKVTDILLCAGANDLAYESQSITDDPISALKEFINYAHTNYPNANVYLGMIGTRRNSEGTMGEGLAKHWWIIVNAYVQACTQAHGTYLSNVETIWSRGGGMGIADGIHPSSGGMQYIALSIAAAWSGIRYTNIERDTLPYTPVNTNRALTLTRSIYDGTYTLLSNAVTDVTFDTTTTVNIAGTKIGEMTDAYINTPVFVNTPVVYNTASGNKMGQSFIELNGKDIILGINELEGEAWKHIDATGFQIPQFQINFPIMYAI